MKIFNRILLKEKTTGFLNDATVLSNFIPNNKIYIGNEKTDSKYAFLNIFIQEITYKNRFFLKKAKYNCLKINQELFLHNHQPINIKDMHQIHIIICKSIIAVDIAKQFRKKYNFKYKIIYTKFTSNIKGLIPSNNNKDWNTILHAAGQHHWKQTDLIVELWIKHPELPKIIITCTEQCLTNIKNRVPLFFTKKYNNIQFHQTLIPKNDFIYIKNKIGIHLCPSLIEGYGHYINEARYLKGLIITSNNPPMNELVNRKTGILINCHTILKKKNKSDICVINENDLLNGIRKAIKMPIEKKKIKGELSYKQFQKDTLFFNKQMKLFITIMYNNEKPLNNSIFC